MGPRAPRTLELWGPDFIFSVLPSLGGFSTLDSSPFIGSSRNLFLVLHNITSIASAGSPEDPRAQLLIWARAREREPRSWPHPSQRKETSRLAWAGEGKWAPALRLGLHAHPGSGHRKEAPAAPVSKGGFASGLQELKVLEISL